MLLVEDEIQKNLTLCGLDISVKKHLMPESKFLTEKCPVLFRLLCFRLMNLCFLSEQQVIKRQLTLRTNLAHD